MSAKIIISFHIKKKRGAFLVFLIQLQHKKEEVAVLVETTTSYSYRKY